MIDTHCHIYAEQFQDDLSEVLNRAADAGVEHIFMPAINLESLPKMDRISHPDISFHKLAGLHPTDINKGNTVSEDTLYEYCSQNDIVGVGETGLDYHWSMDYKEEQQQSLRLHCRVAKDLAMPIVLHNRSSVDDLLDVIEDQQDGSLNGVWHSFTGTAEQGRRALDLGLTLGIGGIFTFKNAGVDKAVTKLPLEQMMLETDAPYLAPDPKRGNRNEPAYLKYTAQKLAEVQQVSVDELVAATDQTALSLFGIA